MNKTSHLKGNEFATIKLGAAGRFAELKGWMDQDAEGSLYVGPILIRDDQGRESPILMDIIDPLPPLEHKRGDVWRRNYFNAVLAVVDEDGAQPWRAYSHEDLSDDELRAYWTRIYREDES